MKSSALEFRDLVLEITTLFLTHDSAVYTIVVDCGIPEAVNW